MRTRLLIIFIVVLVLLTVLVLRMSKKAPLTIGDAVSATPEAIEPAKESAFTVDYIIAKIKNGELPELSGEVDVEKASQAYIDAAKSLGDNLEDDGNYNLYVRIRAKLIEKGVPVEPSKDPAYESETKEVTN